VAVIFALLTIAAIAGLIGAIHSRSRCRKRQGCAKSPGRSRTTDELRKYQYTIAQEAVNRIQQSLLIRQAALSGDQEKFERTSSKYRAERQHSIRAVASDLHYKSGGYDIYKFELFPRPETSASGKDAIAFIPTWRIILLSKIPCSLQVRSANSVPLTLGGDACIGIVALTNMPIRSSHRR